MFAVAENIFTTLLTYAFAVAYNSFVGQGDTLMTKRKFEVELNAYATLELDEAVISVVDDDWRKSLYALNTPEDIAKHIGFNMVVNQIRLSQLDGWADQPDDHARVLRIDWDVEALEGE